jgi:CheY-like chemotaxis protein
MGEPGRLVVVVEDDADLRAVAAGLLAVAGYAVRTYADGIAAWAGLAADWPAALVLDVKLPGLTGIELLERLQLEAGRVPPTVIVTGYALAGETAAITDRARALVAPAPLLVLTKPYDLETLQAAVAAAIAQGEA